MRTETIPLTPLTLYKIHHLTGISQEELELRLSTSYDNNQVVVFTIEIKTESRTAFRSKKLGEI